MTTNMSTMQVKKMAVGRVQAIQFNIVDLSSHPAKGEALGDVVAHEPDHEAPGTMVRTPAAASAPQSMPAAETVRVMVAAMGLALTGSGCAPAAARPS